MEEKQFEIFFKDLSKEAQDRLCKELNTTPEEQNWDVFPMTVLFFEEPKG